MPYTEIAQGLIGAVLFFNAGRMEARGGGRDPAVLWAGLSLLLSLLAFRAGGGWGLWALAQFALFIGIAVVRVAHEARNR